MATNRKRIPANILRGLLSRRGMVLLSVLVVVLVVGALVWAKFINKPVQAQNWWDDRWKYRQTVSIVNNGSAQTNYQVQVVVPTGNLIAASKMNSDCSDLRFTDYQSKPLAYWNEYCRSNANGNSSVWVTVPNLPAGGVILYMYYGNTSATAVSAYTAYPTGINRGDGADQEATVSGTVNINSSTVSGRSTAGPDAFNPASTSLNSAGTSTVTATSSAGLSVGDEILITTFQAASTASAGLYETARVSAINGGNLTINHPLVNTYDGTTNKVMVQRVPNYAGVTLNTNATLNATPWNDTNFTGGVVFFRATGTVTLNAGSTITTTGLGFLGGAGGGNVTGGGTGESYDGVSSGTGGNGGSNGQSRGGGKSGDGGTTSPTDSAITGGGGGGGSQGSTSDAFSGGGGGGGGGYGGGGGGGGGSSDGATGAPSQASGAGGGGGVSGSKGGGGGGGCVESSGGANTPGKGGNAGSNGTAAVSCGGGNGALGAAGASGTMQGSGGGGSSAAGGGGGGGGGGNYGLADLSTMYLGSGGGGGGGSSNSISGTAGGSGGGQVYIGANSLTLNLTAIIVASGSGAAIPVAGGGGGGGGSGGAIFLNVGTLSQLGTNQVAATGGAQIKPAVRVSGSGIGGDGRIHVAYSTMAGTTNPSAHGSALPFATSIASEETGPGPVGYWKMDEGQGTITNDSGRSGVAGTLSGATKPSWQPADMCISGKCLYFDGSSSYVSIADNSNLEPGTAATYEFWVKPNGTPADEYPLVTKWQGAAQYSFYTAITSANQLSIAIDDNGDASSVACSFFSTNANIQSGSWAHLAFVLNGTARPKVYQNGVLLAGTMQGSCPASVFNGTANLLLGSYEGGTINFLKGFFDDFKFYNYVRTADQIKSDYNSEVASIAKGASALLGAGRTDPLNNGLIGYWKMDESSWNGTAGEVADSSGGGNSGTGACNGTCTKATTGTGKFGNGGVFDGTDDYVSLANGNSIKGLSAVTLAAWVKLSATGVNQTIYSEARNSDNSVRFDMNLGAGNKINIGARNNGDSGSYNTLVTSSTALSSGVWYQITATVDFSKGKASIYVNGSLDSQMAISGGFDNTTPFSVPKLGSRPNATGEFLGGTVDELRLYSRVLSPSEVAQLYTFTPGPVGYWNFEEGQGTTINDLSGSGVNGTAQIAGRFASGKYGKAGDFDGANDYVDLGNSLGTTMGTVYTVEAWIYTNSISGNRMATVYRSSSSNTPVLYQLDQNGADVRFIVRDDSSNVATATFTNGLTANAWYHIAGVRVGNNLSVYVNGVLGTRGTGSFGTISQSKQVIGSSYGASGPSSYWNGRIDEVKIYNYERSQKQIIEDMNGGHPTGGSPVASQMDFWKFDEGQGYYSTSSGIQATTASLAPSMAVAPSSVGTSGWNPNGRFGKAISFDGVNDYVDLGDLSYTEGISTMSASFWVNPNSLTTQKCLLCKWQNSAAANKESWAIETGSSNANAILVEISSNGNATGITAETAAGQLAVGTWAHVLVVYDGNNTINNDRIRVYVNGVRKTLAFSATVPTATWATTSNVRVGASSDTAPARLFSGTMDEVKIYSGALTSSDVLIDYNHGQAVNFGVLGTSSADGVTASNSAAAAYCVPGDTTSCSPPVLEWNFEEHAGTVVNDTSGNGLNGLTHNSQPWVAGKIGGALNYNNINQYVSVASNSILNPSNFTAEAWVYWTSIDTNGHAILSKWTGANSYQYLFGTNDPTNDEVALCISADGTATSICQISVGVGFRANRWYHIAVTYDQATGLATFYSNGVKISKTGSLAPNLYTGGAAIFEVGSTEGGTTSYWNGKIDQVKFYNYVRTPVQVAYDYNRGLPQSWWKFDECSGGTENDSVGTVSATITAGTIGDCNTSSSAWFDGKTGKNNYSMAFAAATDATKVVSTNTYPLALNVSNSASWGGWFKPTNFTGSPVLMEKANQFKLSTDTSGNAICAIYHGGAYTPTTGSGATLTAGVWSHVLCTYDGSFVRTYINGNLGRVVSDTSGIAVATTNLYVGQSSAAGNQYTGLADDIKVWAYALTPVQVKLDFNLNSAVRFGPLSGAP